MSLKDEHGSQELLNSSDSLPANSDSDTFQGFDVQPLKPGLRCISLFDGISTALQALDMMGLHVEAYFSSEIDENALKLQRHRFGERIEQLGSVTDLTEQKLKSLGPIHLCIGGICLRRHVHISNRKVTPSVKIFVFVFLLFARFSLF